GFAGGQLPHQDQAMLSAVDAFRDQTGSPAGEDTMSGSSVASILIVDDDRRNLMALQELLQGLGQNLVLADSGEEALRCVLKQEFAVILLDVRMPGVDGFETARLIHVELGQALTGLKMDLTWLSGKLPADEKPLLKKIKSMFRLIDETIRSVRKIASGLRPDLLDEVGLAAAIGWQARDFQLRTG